MPPSARTCGAAAYLNKDELSPRAVRALWEHGGDPAWLSPAELAAANRPTLDAASVDDVQRSGTWPRIVVPSPGR